MNNACAIKISFGRWKQSLESAEGHNSKCQRVVQTGTENM
uniref:Uncharacterized protein n=1 Tax=Anguilla anguilla TaxID=7936 RepID=A0A0E9RIF4_ANGAN